MHISGQHTAFKFESALFVQLAIDEYVNVANPKWAIIEFYQISSFVQISKALSVKWTDQQNILPMMNKRLFEERSLSWRWD